MQEQLGPDIGPYQVFIQLREPFKSTSLGMFGLHHPSANGNLEVYFVVG